MSDHALQSVLAPPAKTVMLPPEVNLWCTRCGRNLYGVPGDPRQCPECGLDNYLGYADLPPKLIHAELRQMEILPTLCAGLVSILPVLILVGTYRLWAGKTGIIDGVVAGLSPMLLLPFIELTNVFFKCTGGWRQGWKLLWQYHRAIFKLEWAVIALLIVPSLYDSRIISVPLLAGLVASVLLIVIYAPRLHKRIKSSMDALHYETAVDNVRSQVRTKLRTPPGYQPLPWPDEGVPSKEISRVHSKAYPVGLWKDISNLDIFCLQCGYNLHGLAGDPRRCPECGYANPLGDEALPPEIIEKYLKKMETAPTACLLSIVLALPFLVGLILSLRNTASDSLACCIMPLLLLGIVWICAMLVFMDNCDSQRGWAAALFRYHVYGIIPLLLIGAVTFLAGYHLVQFVFSNRSGLYALWFIPDLALLVATVKFSRWVRKIIRRGIEPLVRYGATRQARGDLRYRLRRFASSKPPS